VADDSRQVQPGDLFLAYPGDLADGRRYIGDALARGAVAVLWQPGDDFAWASGAEFRSRRCARWPARWRMPSTATRAKRCR
jgi:UDP-N-acetylmuramyl tripeptide synthase